ncbi:MAG TPA: carboxypeptidase-like regulatory domain-containing protein [Thermoanaerobaculia bacterium]|nr:carboxypeptidase-like regulatory domain-containing protein [Thermoanaerobaculia bacterium]
MRHARTAVALFLSLLSLPAVAAITGTVMTGDGTPVAGARVMIHATETPEARRERLLSASPQLVALAETKSDAKGAFSLSSPKEAVVNLRVEMHGYEPESRRVEKDEELGALLITPREMKSGTITAGGKPVEGATVVISYGATEYVARTDAQGKYQAPELRRGRSITVLHPGFAIDEEAFMTVSGSPASELTRTLSTGAAVNGKVVSADGKTPVDKAVISIDGWPAATSAEDGSFVIARAPSKWTTLTARKDALTGQHAFAGGKPLTVRVERSGVISGRVVDAKTKVPVAGASLMVVQSRRFQLANTSMMAITDAKGAYSIPAPAGTFMIMASHPAFETHSTDVTVTAGQPVTRDVNLQQLARVTGVVVDEEGRPLAAARVSSEAAASADLGRMLMMRGDSSPVTSGSDGRFTVRVRGDSDVKLRAAKKGLPETSSDTLRLQPGERKSGVVLTVPSGVAVTGKVVDPDGKPLSGVAVGASETPVGNDRMIMRRFFVGNMLGEEEDVVRTASDGTFTMRLKEGTYDFSFKREGFAPKTVRAQNVAASGSQPVEAKLEVAAEISGRVTRGGVGVPDVMVGVFADSMTTAMTGPDGSFTLGGLAAGGTRVSFRKEEALINEMRTFTAPARDVNVELPLGGTIRGRVVEKGSTKAITSFQAGVSASRSGGGMMMMAPPLLKSFNSEDGSFTLENVPIGAMNLIANATGYSSARLNVDVQEGKTVSDVVLELEPGVRLTGRVTGPNGAGLADASVNVQPSPTGAFAMSGSLRRTTTDANGEYVLDGLDPGEETIQVSHPKYNDVSRQVTLKGRETKLDVQLEGGQTITGVVVTDSGAPVAEAEVDAFSAGGGRHSARTNAGGAFEIEGMRPGRYRFTAAKNGFVEGRVDDVDISAGGPVRITLQTGGSIYGRVTGLTEADMAHVSVTARGSRGSSSAMVDPQGNYRLDGAPLGTVSVSAAVQPRDFTGRRTSATQTVEIAAGSAQQVNIDFRGDMAIKGRITRNGRTLPGANVSFWPRRSGGGASASVTADEQGMYTVTGLEEGEYSVSVIDSQRYSPYTTTYTVRGSATFDIDFKAANVRGRVIDSATNEPLENVNIQFRSTATGSEMRGMRTAMTDSNGVFTVDFVNPGAYIITASRDGFGNSVQEMTFTDAGRDDLELRLSRNDGVVLSIIDARDGRTLSGQVVVFDPQGRQVYDSRGNFRFGDSPKEMRLPLAPGSYTATIWVPDYTSVTTSFSSPSPQPVTVRVTPGGTIVVRSKHSVRRRMRLLDASGAAYPRVMSATPFTRDLPPGTVNIDHVAPGSYTLVLLNDDESTAATQPVVVREGETVVVDL